LLGVEVVLDRARKVKAPGVDADHTGAVRLQLGDEGGVVGLVLREGGREGGRAYLGVDVAFLEDDADCGGSGRVHARHGGMLLVVPLEVLRGVLKHLLGDRVPDAWGREGGREGGRKSRWVWR